MVSVDQAYMVGHMKNADGSINNKNVVLSAACEAAELFQCMMAVNQKLEDWQRFNHTLEMHLRSVECEKIHDICQAVYGMKHPSNELEGLYLAREDEQICLLYYQVFVGMLEININSAEVLYKQKEETINEYDGVYAGRLSAGAKGAVSDGKIQKSVKYSKDSIQLISGSFEICGAKWLGRS